MAAPADALIYTETWDWLSAGSTDPGYPGSALALSYFDDDPNPIPAGYVGTNGAKQTLNSPYQASYKMTIKVAEPDPNGQNVTGFIDGHTKSMPTATLTHQGTHWSIGGNDQWP